MAGTSPRRATPRSSMDRVIRVWRMSPMNGSVSTRCWKRRGRTHSRRWHSLVPASGKTDESAVDHTSPTRRALSPLIQSQLSECAGAVPAVCLEKEVCRYVYRWRITFVDRGDHPAGLGLLEWTSILNQRG